MSGVTENLFVYLFIFFLSRCQNNCSNTKQQLTLGSIFEMTETVVKREQQGPVQNAKQKKKDKAEKIILLLGCWSVFHV